MWGKSRGTWGRHPRARKAGFVGFAIALCVTAAASATHLPIDTEGHTTLEQILVGSNPDNDGYSELALAPDPDNGQYVVRDGPYLATPKVPQAPADRNQVRRSLAYFAQFTDFQLADEESPTRVEMVDAGAGAAWRPQEALTPFEVEASVRQVNGYVPESPVPQGTDAPMNGDGNNMDFAMLTGDNADSVQRNEMEWVRALIEGGTPTNFNSGSTNPADWNPANHPSCADYPANAMNLAEAPKYTGVQDYTDYGNNQSVKEQYYDPNSPEGPFADWPNYENLLDRAESLTITPEGLDVPTYVANGNHDGLVQGNEDAQAVFEAIATGCDKVLATLVPNQGFLDPGVLLSPALTMNVPPDPMRRFVSRPQVKAIFAGQDNGHGFGFVDPAQNAASNGAATYYAWDPVPGFRFINVDTISEGGVVGASANGNVDHPQFQWLENELEDAQDKDKLIVLFSHHPVGSLTFPVPDEAAPACAMNDTHGDTPEHDVNPGCDLDERNSEPIHLGEMDGPTGGESMVSLLDRFPNVIAYVAGHTHQNNLEPHLRSSEDSAWWGIETSAVADWPTQSRLIDVMDNRNDTLSIFGTLVDHASDSITPAAPADASAFDANQLASIGREITFNDGGGGSGANNDQNVEMLSFDPREADLSVTKTDSPDPVTVGQPLTYTVNVTNADDLDDVSGATGVTLTDDLPPTVNFVSATSTHGSCPPNTPAPAPAPDVVCAIGDLASGETATVTITVTPQTAGPLPITNTATADAIFNDPVAANDTASAQTTVTPILAQSADLELTKTGSPGSLTVGDQLVYTLSVLNKGPDAATGVAVTDPLPSGVVLSSATSPGGCETDAGVVTCILGTVPSSGTASAQITLVPQVGGSLVNQASVLSGVSDPIPGNNSDGETTQVQAKPAAASPGGAQGRCRGKTATIAGTAAGETITGTPGPDVIAAGADNDSVLGGGGRDFICGQGGNDQLSGGGGRDLLIGGRGSDKLFGGRGRDRARGGQGRDRCRSAKQSSCQRSR